MQLSYEQKIELSGANVKINHIIFSPFEAMHSHKPTEALTDFFSSLQHNAVTAKKLVKQLPQIKEVITDLNSDEFSDDLIQSDFMPWFAELTKDFPFILQLEIPVPKNIKFRDGKAVGWTVGGLYQIDWIMAKDMQHAYELIIAAYEDIKAAEIKKQLAKSKKK